jgi:fido (protein-threonine AMPylation protein)
MQMQDSIGGASEDGFIDPEEAQYLLPALRHLTLRSELFELEALNQAAGRAWLRQQSPTVDELLSQSFQLSLHRELYGDVWTWAGKRRKRENNIGVAPEYIADQWEQLMGNTRHWISQTVFPLDEACIRYYFGQREIQPFHDGNSRLARVSTNHLAEIVGLAQPGTLRFTFGRGRDIAVVLDELRAATALARATGQFDALVRLARS